jgi:hypothetical protein
MDSLEDRQQSTQTAVDQRQISAMRRHLLPGLISVSIGTGPSHADCLRQVPGDVPNWRLNARLNAASDS